MCTLDRNAPLEEYRTWIDDLADDYRIVSFTDPEAPELLTFYEAYDRAFVLEAEKEEYEGLRACLRLNSGAQHDGLAVRYGRFTEVVSLLLNKQQECVGGANYFALEHDGAITVNLNYVFVTPDHRRMGFLRLLTERVRLAASSLFRTSEDRPVFIFVEQNDPIRMRPQDYIRDNDMSGIDQMDRLRIWHRLGVRLLDIAYEQPALSANQTPEKGLLYGVLPPQNVVLSSCLILAHLRGFFSISVLKGRSAEDDDMAGAQLKRLSEACDHSIEIKMIDHKAALYPGPDAAAYQSHSDLFAYLRNQESRRS
jgi:hypothetical protein